MMPDHVKVELYCPLYNKHTTLAKMEFTHIVSLEALEEIIDVMRLHYNERG